MAVGVVGGTPPGESGVGPAGVPPVPCVGAIACVALLTMSAAAVLADEAIAAAGPSIPLALFATSLATSVASCAAAPKAVVAWAVTAVATWSGVVAFCAGSDPVESEGCCG